MNYPSPSSPGPESNGQSRGGHMHVYAPFPDLQLSFHGPLSTGQSCRESYSHTRTDCKDSSPRVPPGWTDTCVESISRGEWVHSCKQQDSQISFPLCLSLSLSLSRSLSLFFPLFVFLPFSAFFKTMESVFIPTLRRTGWKTNQPTN